VQLALRGIMLVNVPMMLGLAAVAEPLVLTLFGTRWLPAVPIMQVLCLGGVLWPLHVINLNVLLAQGYSHLFFRLEVAKKVLGVSFLAAGALFGVMGMAWSQVAFGPLAFAINAHYSKRFLDYGIVAQVRDLASMFAAAIAMAIGTYWIGTRLNLAPILELLVLTGLGSASYLLIVWLCRLAALRDVIEVVRSRKLTVPRTGSVT
jgi:O-antigen/teichoic acid export membrane protein